MKEHYSVIDIGSCLCRVVVGRFLADGKLDILGIGSSPSQGLKAGTIVNIESVAQCITESIQEAELMSGISIEGITANISGSAVASHNSNGVVAVSNKESTVSHSDIMRVMEAAQNIQLQNDHNIIHVLSRDFSLDNHQGIRDPIGMTGIRLEAQVHIVSARNTALSNIEKALAMSGIRLESYIMSSLACADALLCTEEKDLGMIVVDIGGGVTDIIFYMDGGVCYSTVIPIGGMHITQDISMGLKIPIESAEFVKKNYGSSKASLVDPTERIELPNTNQRSSRFVLRQQITEIIEARVREILEMVDGELLRSKYKSTFNGNLILSGGTALLDGIDDLAEEVLGINVSSRYIQNITGFAENVQTPEFATAIGSLHYINRMGGQKTDSQRAQPKRLLKRITNWLVENV